MKETISISDRDPRQLVDIDVVCQIFNLAKGTIYNQLSAGTFPIKPIRLGRKSLRWRVRDLIENLDRF